MTLIEIPAITIIAKTHSTRHVCVFSGSFSQMHVFQNADVRRSYVYDCFEYDIYIQYRNNCFYYVVSHNVETDSCMMHLAGDSWSSWSLSYRSRHFCLSSISFSAAICLRMAMQDFLLAICAWTRSKPSSEVVALSKKHPSRCIYLFVFDGFRVL